MGAGAGSAWTGTLAHRHRASKARGEQEAEEAGAVADRMEPAALGKTKGNAGQQQETAGDRGGVAAPQRIAGDAPTDQPDVGEVPGKMIGGHGEEQDAA